MRDWKRVDFGRKKQIIVLCCALMLLWLILAGPNRIADSTMVLTDQRLGRGVVVDHIRGQDVYWEYPKSQSPVKGVLVFMHGCNHGGGDLWPPSPQCPHCLGLPEEMRLRRAALRHGLFLMGISSLNRTGKRCWHELKADGGKNVARIIQDVLNRQRLTRFPLFLVGASSGGQMVLSLPSRLQKDVQISVTGVYAQIRGLPPENELPVFYQGYPPTAFVHMPRDGYNEPMIQHNMGTLRGLGTPILDVETHPRPLTVDFFTSRSPLINARMAKDIIAALRDAKMVDSNNFLVTNPRGATRRWSGYVQPVVGNLSLVLDESHVGELLNVAWAKHELVGDHADRVLEWLGDQG